MITFYPLISPNYITLKDEDIPNDTYNYYRVISSGNKVIESKENVQVIIQRETERINRLSLSENFDLNEALEKFVKAKGKGEEYLDFGQEYIGR